MNLACGDERGALAAFALALDGNRGVVGKLCAARLLILQQRLPEAREILERITSQQPALAEGWTLLGSVLRQQSDTVAAARCFRAALATNPGDALAAAGLTEIVDVQEP